MEPLALVSVTPGVRLSSKNSKLWSAVVPLLVSVTRLGVAFLIGFHAGPVIAADVERLGGRDLRVLGELGRIATLAIGLRRRGDKLADGDLKEARAEGEERTAAAGRRW